MRETPRFSTRISFRGAPAGRINPGPYAAAAKLVLRGNVRITLAHFDSLVK